MVGNPHNDQAVANAISAPASTASEFDFLGFLNNTKQFISGGLQAAQDVIGSYYNFNANLDTVEAQATVAKSQAKAATAAAQANPQATIGGVSTTTLLIGAVAVGAVVFLARR